MDIYKTPEAELERKENFGNPPGTAYLIIFIFILKAISLFLINWLGVYGLAPTPLVSAEMAIVIVATNAILYWVCQMTIKGSKTMTIALYVFLAISLVFDGPNWVNKGVLFGLSEFLTLVNFVLMLLALYLVKIPLRHWYVR